KYDIIFCRDALIYFPNGNRRAAMNALAELLLDEGLLFLGFSETSGASHPQLASRYSSGVFYFQKIPRGEMQAASDQMPHGIEPSAAPDAKAGKYKAHLARALRPKQLKALELCQEISAFMLDNGGKPNAQKTLKAIANDKMGRKNLHPPSDAELAAAALYFLGARNSSCANIALEYFHRCCSGTFPVFLRGEYHLLLGNAEASVNCFRRAFALDNSFWPAPYKIALQSGGEDEGKIREALKSMDMGAALGYECLLGGFPPDHFRRILEGKLARK
ncbi:MAG: hypothetical protein FWE09_03670, partial [Treponema sp.]|nr:hypothetical protein [Treponema sp.]